MSRHPSKPPQQTPDGETAANSAEASPWRSLAQRAALASAARTKSGTRQRALVVLIVDDDADSREVYSASLAVHEMQVLCAENGAVGLEQAKEVRPDLIVMDLSMPVMGGLEALEKLKLDERTRHIPVVVLSGDAVAEHARATSAGCSAILTKPCLPSDLEGVVVALVESRRLTSAGR